MCHSNLQTALEAVFTIAEASHIWFVPFIASLRSDCLKRSLRKAGGWKQRHRGQWARRFSGGGSGNNGKVVFLEVIVPQRHSCGHKAP